jgi:hypothetical protein
MRFAVDLAVLLLSASAQARAVSYAVAVGNNAAPSPDLATLRYADDDAVRYYELFSAFAESAWLLSTMDGPTRRRYPEAFAHARPPTLASLDVVVSEIAERMRGDIARGDQPVLYFTFSGHGTSDESGRFYLAFLDGGLTRERLYEGVLTKLPDCLVHLILDACHAESIVGMRGLIAREVQARAAVATEGDARDVLAAATLERYPRVGALVATTVEQEAHEWSRLESGVFTHEVLSGLRGAADINGDGRIEYSEIQAFVASANRELKDPRAIPHVIAAAPQADLHAALLSLSELRNVGFLTGDPRSLGRFYVELENGERILDAHLAEDLRARLAVPAGRVGYLRSGDLEARLHLRQGEEQRLEALAMHRSEEQVRGSIEASYRKGLFAAAFGVAYYQDFISSVGGVPVLFGPGRADGPNRTTARAELDRSLVRTVAIAGVATGGAGLVSCMATALLAARAKRDAESTDLQRPAAEARQRFLRLRAASVTTGAIGGALVAGGSALWILGRGSDLPVTLAVGLSGLAVAGSW